MYGRFWCLILLYISNDFPMLYKTFFCGGQQMTPGPQMIPKLDRKWSRNACGPHIEPQMIPTKN